ncbi:MAG: DUF4384 domain-containing protein [Myxococcales bacterium]|nr:DUF4384 domain-containing protein [Myxococcales bacterium]MCB9670113.1 DUF4384 domain-containing protein [Alphaproteobacteria bacterium]MCB9693553.1 DUF4384 domain-containing protein [Alphaproteobacteria bacterium]
MNTAMTGLRRDGHISDLALEHLLDDDALPGTEDHLATCDVCRARLAAARATDAMPLPALPPMASVAPEPTITASTPGANRPWTWAPMLLAAAVALFVATAALRAPGEDEDTFRIKGASVALQVFRDEGESSQRLRDGDTIAPGDRLGFRVRQRRSGHLMVIGIDDRDEPYLCYPQSRDGESAPHGATLEPQPLPEAIRMDDKGGSELLVAIVCEEPFTFEEMSTALLEDRVPSDCATDRLELIKP